MEKWISLLTLVVVAFILLPVPVIAQIQSPPGDAGTDQYSRNGPTAGDDLAALAYLGIDGPEDFDYCDEQGCHLLGPSGKEFFICDLSWSCRYVLWGSFELGPDDFDYLEVGAKDPNYEEVGSCYACGPTGVCLNVAEYNCDAAGNCIYHMGDTGRAGGEDVVPEIGESARGALEGFSEALANAPATKTRSALAEEVDPFEAATAEGDVERGSEANQKGADQAGVDQAGVDQAGKAKPNDSSDADDGAGDAPDNATNGSNPADGSSGEQSLAGGSDKGSDNGSDGGRDGNSGNDSGDGNASGDNASNDGLGTGGILSAAGSLPKNSALLVLGTLVVLIGGTALLVLKVYR